MVLSTFGSDSPPSGGGESGKCLRTAHDPRLQDANAKCERICDQGAGSVGGESCLLIRLRPGTLRSADADCAGVDYDARHPALVALVATARITRTHRRGGRHPPINGSDPASVRLSERQLPRKERRRVNFVMRMRSVVRCVASTMSTEPWQFNLEAKIHAVEVIGSHRCLAAPAHDWKENQAEKRSNRVRSC